jgi:hypothetical protein
MSALSRNGPELLFHYTGLEAALEHILPTLKFRMGDYRKTNDPREAKWNIGFGVTTSGQRNIFEIGDSAWAEVDRVHSLMRMACFTRDNRNAEYTELRGFGCMRMWAQYADRHRGVCLGFDKASLTHAFAVALEKTDRLIKGAVCYYVLEEKYRQDSSELRARDIDGDSVDAIGASMTITKHLREHQESLLFTKSRDWEDEKEYRWVYVAQDESDEVLISLGNSLRYVILGLDFPDPYLPSLFELCRDRSIELYRMMWSGTHLGPPMPLQFPGNS